MTRSNDETSTQEHWVKRTRYRRIGITTHDSPHSLCRGKRMNRKLNSSTSLITIKHKKGHVGGEQWTGNKVHHPPPPPITQKKRNIKTFNITVLIKTQRLLVKRVNKTPVTRTNRQSTKSKERRHRAVALMAPKIGMTSSGWVEASLPVEGGKVREGN